MTTTEQTIDREIEYFNELAREFKNIPPAPNSEMTTLIDLAPKDTILIIGQEDGFQTFYQAEYDGVCLVCVGIIDKDESFIDKEITSNDLFRRVIIKHDSWLIMKKV